MPETPDIFDHPSVILRSQKVNIISLYNVIEDFCPQDKVSEYQGMVVKAVQSLIDGDFHSFDSILHAVGLAVNETIKHQK